MNAAIIDAREQYEAHGWRVVPIHEGKGPKATGWNLPDRQWLPSEWANAIGLGLLHAESGTMAFDVDDLAGSIKWFAERGLDLPTMLGKGVGIARGDPNRTKRIYAAPAFMLPPSVKVPCPDDGHGLFELRCASANGRSVQDLLPPSLHPTGSRYQWEGDWKAASALPETLLTVWQSLRAPVPLPLENTITSTASTDATWTEITEALEHINPDCSRQDWITVGMGLHAHGAQCNQIDQAFTVWNTWSAMGAKYPGPRAMAQQWHSFRDDKVTTVTMGSVFKLARDAGWTRPQVDASGLFSATTWDSSKSRDDEPRYKLLGSADLAAMPALAWRIRGVLPAKGLAAIFGPSGCGKSFLGFDMAAAIADGCRWFNCRVEAAPVVYAALEGEAGFKLRAQAWEAYQGRKLPAGLQMVLQAFKLTEPHDVRDLAAVVPAGAVVFLDTLNRAAPTADENSSRDMGEILEAAKRLQTMTGGLVVLIHHTGKDATKGLRGHSSLFAALDAAVEVSRTGDRREWMVAKSKDGQDGDAHPFKLQVETLGLDDYGDLMTSCVVVPDAVARAVRAVKLPQGGNQKLVFDALRPMFNDGTTGKPGAPPLRPCIELEAAIAKAAGHLTCEASRRSTRAREAITGLVAREVMGSNEGWLWLSG